jgi:hypothetical protein
LKPATSPQTSTPPPTRRNWKRIVAYTLAAVVALAVLCAGLLLWVIGSSMGPAFPERDGRAYLEKHNYPAELIERVVALGAIDAASFEKLVGEDSVDVKFLIAQNPTLPAPLLDRLTRDASDFVRGGAALNPHLTAAQIQALSTDGSHTTESYLARNPNVPQADLIRLHEVHGIELMWFAMNPQIPPVLQQKIIASKDEDALYWLKETQESAQ